VILLRHQEKVGITIILLHHQQTPRFPQDASAKDIKRHQHSPRPLCVIKKRQGLSDISAINRQQDSLRSFCVINTRRDPPAISMPRFRPYILTK
jgi:hypothetical protein